MSKFVYPSVELIDPPDYLDVLYAVQNAARFSTGTQDSFDSVIENIPVFEHFISARLEQGHYSILRHAHISFCFTCSRRVSHELVRHHVGIDFVQESTRWCNYSKNRFSNELTFVMPPNVKTEKLAQAFKDQADAIENIYMHVVKEGMGPDIAGYFLNNMLKTSVVATANIEALRSLILKRSGPDVLPEFRYLATALSYILTKEYPVFFKDINEMCDYEPIFATESVEL